MLIMRTKKTLLMTNGIISKSDLIKKYDHVLYHHTTNKIVKIFYYKCIILKWHKYSVLEIHSFKQQSRCKRSCVNILKKKQLFFKFFMLFVNPGKLKVLKTYQKILNFQLNIIILFLSEILFILSNPHCLSLKRKM